MDYITDTTQAALEIGKPNKITLEDITYVIRKDKRKGKKFSFEFETINFAVSDTRKRVTPSKRRDQACT